MPSRIFGYIPSVSVGTTFENRAALAAAGVHRPMMAGISGTPEEGADSIVLSGGYEDDTDEGDVDVCEAVCVAHHIAEESLCHNNVWI